MENTHEQQNNMQNEETSQEAIMNRVNQTFDKLSQDVKEMINKNNSQLS
nr:hypothetical protein [Neobacillus sp. Marseille-Q6967]